MLLDLARRIISCYTLTLQPTAASSLPVMTQDELKDVPGEAVREHLPLSEHPVPLLLDAF